MAAALAAAGCVAAEDEAADLVAAAAGPDELAAMVARRVTGEPLAWITGTTVFCGLEVAVRPGVYVPRWQSEALARTAAALLPERGTAVDLGTGAGAVALVLQGSRPHARVLATETDPAAVACARANGVEVLEGDLDAPLPAGLAGQVDVLCGVLPYVPSDAFHLLPRDVAAHEPRMALDGGADGTAVLARAVAAGPRWLCPGGWLILEAGGGQFAGLESLLAGVGFVDLRLLTDGDGDPRAVGGRWAGTPSEDGHPAVGR